VRPASSRGACIGAFAGCGAAQPAIAAASRRGAKRIADSYSNRHVLLYGSGKTLWANELSPSCGFGANDILVSEPMGSYYCRGDLVRSIDRYSRIPGPACVIGEFVPYVRGG
jgi:hypothetical protein